MARASYTQGNFLGGEWSPSAQGRMDLPIYRSALALCRNAIVSETGAAIRRSGTRFIQPTYKGLTANLMQFAIQQQQSYVIEETYDTGTQDLWIRCMMGGHMVTDGTHVAVTNVSTANPCQITLNSAEPWLTGDQIVLQVGPNLQSGPSVWSFLMNRTFTVTKVDTTHFTLQDMLTGSNVSGAGVTGTQPTIVAVRIPKYTNAMWNSAGAVALTPMTLVSVNGNAVIIPSPATYGTNGTLGAPAVLAVSSAQSQSAYAAFTLGNLQFFGGPYQASITDTCTLTFISGASYTFTAAAGTFAAPQIGDPIRINLIANLWLVGTAYGTTPTVVTDPGSNAQFVNITASGTNTGNIPSESPNYWAPFANGSIQLDCEITAVAGTTSITVVAEASLPVNLASYFPQTYQLAYYGQAAQLYPQTGLFHEGRLFFGDKMEGVQASTVFGFTPPSAVYMNPTDIYGNVLDDSGINEQLLSSGTNSPLWMIPDANGVLIGTQAGEWLMQATSLGEPITPTSFQAHQFTRYGSTIQVNQVVRPGIAIVFIDRYAQRAMEYITDPFTNKFSGRPLNQYAKQLVRNYNNQGLTTLAYSETPEPLIWAMGNYGGWMSCTYRRVSSFTTEVPLFNAWALHTFTTTSRSANYLCNSFTADGTSDQLYLMTQPSASNMNSWNECLEPLWSDNDTLMTAWPVDSGVTGVNYGHVQGGGNDGGPVRCEGCVAQDNGAGAMVIAGFYYMIGTTVSAWIGGLDCGDYVVDANGCVTVPYGSDPGGFSTLAYLESLTDTTTPVQGSSWPTVTAHPVIPLQVGSSTYYIPGVVGYKFTSQLQRLRPDDQETARTQQGTGSGSLKRHHWYSLLIAAGVANTIQVGTNPTGTLYPATLLNYDTGAATPTNVLFSGVHRDTIQSDYDLDGQMYVQLTRPAPMVLSSWTGFMETNEI